MELIEMLIDLIDICISPKLKTPRSQRIAAAIIAGIIIILVVSFLWPVLS